MRTIYLIFAIFILSSCVQPQVSLPDYSNVLTDKERKILIDAGYNLLDIENINQEIKALEFNQ